MMYDECGSMVINIMAKIDNQNKFISSRQAEKKSAKIITPTFDPATPSFSNAEKKKIFIIWILISMCGNTQI